MEEIKNPHDAFFKETLSRQENARSFLDNYLPKEVREIIDLDYLEIEKDSFIGEELREYFSDLLYKVRFHGNEGYIYILFEHKSYSESWIGLQLLEYMLRCWKLKRKHKQPLPVVIPLVLYHGEKKWSAGLKFSDILEYKDARLKKYIPDFEYILYDLTRYQDEDITGVVQLKVMLQLLRYIKSPAFLQKLADILTLFARDPDMRYLITITMYVLSATNIPQEKFVKMVYDKVSGKGGETSMGTLQTLLRKERKEGLKEGLKEGGIKVILEMKFGAEGMQLMKDIREIEDMERLQQILEMVKKAESLEEVRREL